MKRLYFTVITNITRCNHRLRVDQKGRSSDWFEVTRFVSLEQNSRSYQFEKKLSRKKIRILLSLLSTNPITEEHFVSVLYLFGQFQR